MKSLKDVHTSEGLNVLFHLTVFVIPLTHFSAVRLVSFEVQPRTDLLLKGFNICLY